jgi:hypothetical protein
LPSVARSLRLGRWDRENRLNAEAYLFDYRLVLISDDVEVRNSGYPWAPRETPLAITLFDKRQRNVRPANGAVRQGGNSLGLETTMGMAHEMWVRLQLFCHHRRNCETLST